LYSPYVSKTKLVKYHFSKNHAIFYFIYRDGGWGGVHFNLIISIEELEKLYGKKKNYLINEGTNIFIINKID
jgi:hypothetical protein